MKKILRQVSAAEMRGPLTKFHELLADERMGHYWLNQLTLLMRKEPTHVMSNKWLEALDNLFTWRAAEKHYQETGDIWYNEPHWPFQICVLQINDPSMTELRKFWIKNLYCINMVEDIPHLYKPKPFEKRKIALLRLQARYLGYTEDCIFSDVNRSFPKLGLSVCPVETAFFLRPLIKDYFDSKSTGITMKFRPPSMVDNEKFRVYHFAPNKGAQGNQAFMDVWDISVYSRVQPSDWWIFQHSFCPGQD